MRSCGAVEADWAKVMGAAWLEAFLELKQRGIEVGAHVVTAKGTIFRIVRIEPKFYGVGKGAAPAARIVIHGVKWRQDGTWGTHVHWVGWVRDIAVCP